MVTGHMTKVPEYPRPHNWNISFGIPVESAAARFNTIIPIVTYDEGLGAMSAYESHPTNANFVETASDHCYPTSKVNKIFGELTVSMSKVMLETDKVHVIRFATATIHSAFNETKTAEDEVSTLDLNEILELDTETTDRQMYPLWNDIDLNDYKLNADLDMPAETPGLDTDLEIEGTAFSTGTYYNCLQYMTNGPKLRNVCTPLKWHTLSRNRPTTKVYFHQQSNTKYMNPYTFLGAMIIVPANGSLYQLGQAGDTTIETCQLNCTWNCRYYEYNHEFNHAML